MMRSVISRIGCEIISIGLMTDYRMLCDEKKIETEVNKTEPISEDV